MKKWEKLPDEIRRPEVLPFYEHLRKHRVSLGIKRILDLILAVLLLLILSVSRLMEGTFASLSSAP